LARRSNEVDLSPAAAVCNAAFVQEVEVQSEVCEEAKSVNEAQLKDRETNLGRNPG
jgi:hypothetical protein